ncbi:MAG: site-specific tyrosine recombinase XerD [Propioniciclava sp.]
MSALEREIADYLDHLTAVAGASVHTVAGYRRDLARYRAHLVARGVTRAGEVTPDQVAAFAAGLRAGEEGPGLAAASVARAIAAVRSFHTFAVDDGSATDNPAARVSPPKQGRPLPKALSVGQVQALLDAPDTTTLTGLRDAALLELLYGTGARVSEVIGLDVDDVSSHLENPDLGLRLFGKGRKERIVPLGSFARAAVGAWLVRGRPEMIRHASRPGPALLLNKRGNRLSRQSAFAVVRENAERAGLPQETGPHTLRHSFATHLLDGGADVRVVQELLGHASVTTTQIYTLVTAEHLREVFLAAHPRAR